jgi:sec-independent protein translocase protein TatB
MFEIDFFKLVIVAMIGLVVLGPEKLPGLAAKLGRWVGRARSMARQFRLQLEQEVLLEETRQQNKQTIRNPATQTPSAQPSPAPSPEVHETQASHVATSSDLQKTDHQVSHASEPGATQPAIDPQAARTHE